MSQSPRRDGGRWAAHEDIEPSPDHDEDDQRFADEDRLVDDDRHPDGDRLDRMLGDADLMMRLQLTSYAPEVWKPVAEEFARYGLVVIRSWIRRGLIFGYVKKATGFGLPAPPDRAFADRDTVNDLASSTVVNALGAFLEIALKKKNWDSSKGASLKTYFIGQCKIQFSNVYREWLRTQRRRAPEESLNRLVDRNVLAPAHNDVEDQFDRDAEIDEALGMIESAQAQIAFMYQAEGYSYATIAEWLELKDAKAVDNLLYRWKRRIAIDRRDQSA